jgi:hypothetical protein
VDRGKITITMRAPNDLEEHWIQRQVRHFAKRSLRERICIFTDTTDFMAIDRDHVVELDGELFLVTCTEKEKRFGLEDEPKFWVKRALALGTGRTHILKMVFHEVFLVGIRERSIRCERNAEKEGRVLEVMRGDPRFMQGRVALDACGNVVRVIDFIEGVDFLNHLDALDLPHEQYFHTELRPVLANIIESFRGIQQLHEAGLCHGDIRNDHILVEGQTGRFVWIDFDLAQKDMEFDVWSLGNILHCVLARGFVTFRDVHESNPEAFARLMSEDASVFFPHRVMNLRKVYPYLPAKLNDVLLRYSVGCHVPYERVSQVVEDLEDCAATMGS